MTRDTRRQAAAVAAVLLFSGAGLSAVQAQDDPQQAQQGGQMPPPGNGGQFGGGRFGGGNGQGGGRFGGGANSFMANIRQGTVSSVDAKAGTITVSGPDGTAQTVQVSPATTLTEQMAGTVADLKVGDTVRVSGVPTAMTAVRIQSGQMPTFGGGQGGGRFGGGGQAGQGAGRFGGGGGQFGGGGGQFGGGGQAGAARSGGGPQANVSATVATTSPLTLKMEDGTTVSVKTSATTQVTRMATVTLSALKVGDRVLATGQPDDNGAFTATMVAVNMSGGFGGGQGGGRFGGQGGGQGGGRFGGGQGGGQGFNRRRGGQGNPPPADGQTQGANNSVAPGGGNMAVLLNGE